MFVKFDNLCGLMSEKEDSAGEPPVLASERWRAGYKSAPSEHRRSSFFTAAAFTVTLICLLKEIVLAVLEHGNTVPQVSGYEV